MSLVLSECSCCDGYVIKCSICGARTARCSQASNSEAVEFAKKKGWQTIFRSITAPGQWVCPNHLLGKKLMNT